MLETFPLKDMIITLDALHCQTKTAKAIKKSGNAYVLQVKNQKRLLEQIVFNNKVLPSLDTSYYISNIKRIAKEYNRGICSH